MSNFYLFSLCRYRTIRWCFFLLIGLLPLLAQGQVSGIVFKDINGNGTLDNTTTFVENGIPNIAVKAYNPANTLVGSATTSAFGSYTIASVSGALRIEFTNLPSGVYEGPNGLGSKTSVQFVTGPATNVNFGANCPEQYNTNLNPKLYIPCYVNGNPLGGGTAGSDVGFVSFNFADQSTGTTPGPETSVLSTSALGSVWSVVHSRQANTNFVGAFLKRHMGMGQLGSGGIYLVNPSGTVTQWLNLDAIGIPTSQTGTYGTTVTGQAVTFSPIIGTNTQRGLPADKTVPNNDPAAFDQVGKVSLGGMDLSFDGQYLYVVNLYDRKIYQIDLTTPTSPVAPTSANKATKIKSWSVPNPGCTNGTYRPWACKFYKGKIYVGVVCSGENGGGEADITQYVYVLDPATGFNTTPVLTIPNYTLRNINSSETWASAQWKPWTNEMMVGGATASTSEYWSSGSPILSDIEFDTDGSMIVSIMERGGHQGGLYNYPPAGNTFLITTSAGDILRAYPNTTMTSWTLENNGDKDGSGPYVATAAQQNMSGPGGGEFYYEDKGGGIQGTPTPDYWHQEVGNGALAFVPGTNIVAAVGMDPLEYNSGGIFYFNNSTGKTDRRLGIFPNLDETPTLFGKAIGLGDIDYASEIPPIQIGNRVWNDLDNDGVQEAGEPTLAGVVVQLKGPGVPANTTAITNSNGEYYFTNATGTSSTSAIYSLTGLTAGSSYSLCFPLSTSAASLILSKKPNSATGTNADRIDADPDSAGIISFTLGQAGDNNFSYDAAYLLASCAISLTANPGACNPATNKYAVTGTISLTGNSAGGTATITDGTKVTSVAIPANASAVSYTLAGLSSGTGSHTITVSLTGCGTTSTTYTAPPTCLTTSACMSIDKWVDEQSLGSTGGPITGVVTGPGILGGERDMVFSDLTPSTANGITANVVASQGAFPVPVLEIANASSRFSKLTITWDGVDGNATTLNPSGLGGLNFLAVGATGFTANINTDGAAGTGNLPVTVRVYDISGGISEAVIIVPPYNSVFNPFNAPFSSLTTVSGGGADLTKVGAIVMVIDMTTRNGWDVVLDDFKLVCSSVCALNATATPGVCNSATNQYTVSGSISLTNNAAGGTATITDGARSTTVSVPANATSVAYSLTGLTSNGASHTVTVSLAGCGTALRTYTAPASCSSATVATGCPGNLLSNGSLENGTFNSFTTSNPNINGTLATYGGSQSIFLSADPGGSTLPDKPITGFGANTGYWVDATTNTGLGAKDGNRLFAIPANIGANKCLFPNAGLGFAYLQGNCYKLCFWAAQFDPASPNNAGLTSVFNFEYEDTFGAGSPGAVSNISVSPSATSNTGSFRSVSWILPASTNVKTTTGAAYTGGNGQTVDWTTLNWQYICLDFTPTVPSNQLKIYLSTTNVNNGVALDGICATPCATTSACKIAATATPGTCNTATNQYAVSGSISLTSNTAGGTATITDGAISTTVSVAASATSVAYSLTGLTSGSGSHTVTVSLAGCGTASTTYAAPVSCTVAPTALAVVVGTPVCNSATNQYNTTGTVSLTNATAGSLTITDNGTTVAVISVTAGQTSASFSVSGVSGSSPATHSVVASLSGTTASTTYATPASCTVCSLSLTTSALANGQVGLAYSQTLTASGGTAPLTFTVSVGTLPAGLNLNAATGVISGTPTSATTTSFTVKVTDAKNCSTIAPLTITTAADPVCSLTATATPGVCNSATNQYAVTGTVSATNAGANSPQTLTVSVNGTSTVVTLTGNGPVSYTLAGLTSDGLTKTVSVVSSASACGLASVTYAAPASCTVAALKASLGDYVWLDNNKNGVQDDGATGVQNVTVVLCDATSGSTISTTLTDANGGYLFPNLNPGSYRVKFTAPTGMTFTTPLAGTSTATDSNVNSITGQTGSTAPVSLSAGENNLTIDAGLIPIPAVPVLAVVTTTPVCNSATNQYTTTATVSLTNAPAGTLRITDNGAVVGTVSVTAGQTSASFTLTGVSGSSPANHSVVATLTNGVTVVASTTYATPASCTVCSVSLTTSALANGQIGAAYSETLTASGGSAPLSYTVSAGSLPTGLSLNPTTGVISGIPTAPAGTASFSVTVTDAKNCSALVPLTITTSALPVCELTATATPGVCNSVNNTYTVTGTVSSTNAAINNASPQTLTVSVNGTSTVVTLTGDGPVSYTLAGLTSDGLTKTVSVVSSASACGMASVTYTAPASCTVAPALASLGDKVFVDTNKNGIQDAGDTPLAGVTVTLISNGTVVATTTTLNSGTGIGCYSFTGLTPGVPYSVSFTTPPGYSVTTPNSGTNDAIDSDAVNGVTQSVTLAPGEYNPTLDAGFVPLKASLGDYVWFDTNQNGVQDEGATGVQSVTVVLCDATSGSTISTTLTDANGGYLFSNLDPGSYRVKFTAPTGMTFTSPLAGTSTATDSNVNSITGQTGSTVAVSLSAGENNPTIDAGLVPVGGPILQLRKLVSKPKAKIGEVIAYTLVLTNTGTLAATNQVVSDTLSAGLNVVPGSVTTSVGSFSSSGQNGTWTIPSLPANGTATLTYSASVTASGVLFNRARIRDFDGPEDEDEVCTSVPMQVCKNEPFAFELSAPTGYSRYQWYLTTPNGTSLVSDVTATSANAATAANYTATVAGEYTVRINDGVQGVCPDGSCCPVIIEEVEVPSYTVVSRQPTCVGSTPQANGQLTLSNLMSVSSTAQYVYQVSTGSSFSASTAQPASPVAVPSDGVIGINLAQGTYTVRVWVLVDGVPGCPRDVTVSLVANCACPEEICLPVVIKKTKAQGRTLP